MSGHDNLRLKRVIDPADAGFVGDRKWNCCRRSSSPGPSIGRSTALAELNGYSDRELSDLGLTSADIVRTAYEEAEQSVESTPRGPAHGAALATAA